LNLHWRGVIFEFHVLPSCIVECVGIRFGIQYIILIHVAMRQFFVSCIVGKLLKVNNQIIQQGKNCVTKNGLFLNFKRISMILKS